MKDVDLPQTQGDDYQMENGGMESIYEIFLNDRNCIQDYI